MLEIFKGMQQGSESIQVYLQKWRDVAESAWGPASGFTMSQESLILKKICEGLSTSELSKLTVTIIITLPFQWTALVDSVIQFQQRINTQPPQHVNAIQQKESRRSRCFKCNGDHLVRDCRKLICHYCGGQHKNVSCNMSGQTTFCSKCKSIYHNDAGHFPYLPSSRAPKRLEINMIEATSFVEGAVSMDMDSTGNNFKPIKMLVDTGALIPSGIAISEQFFVT